MTATVHILCGPAGAGKTLALLRRCRSAAAGAPQSVLWLSPTLRRAEEVRALLCTAEEEESAEASQRRRGCISPLVCTFQDFADEVVAANDPGAWPLSRVQQRLLVDEVVADLHGRGGLAHFARVLDTRGFTEGTLALLEELKRQEIRPGQFARAAHQRPENGLAPTQVARLYARYQQHLTAQRLLDPEDRLWRARDLLALGRSRPFESVQAVFVDDFVDFTPTELDILDAFYRHGAELWLSLLDESDEERAELFSVSRGTLQRLQRFNPQLEYRASGVSNDPGNKAPGSLLTPLASAGLTHLERHLFRPLRTNHPAADATGVDVIQAPGMLGEARLVARRIKTLLYQGTAAEDVLVSVRDVLPYADLLREVFGDYGIPVDVEGTEPLTRNPAVALLLKALRLPEDDWPFAGVTALLRSSYFRPQWLEARFDAEVPQLSEALLRLLGEPRGRDAYLEAVRRWADRQQPGLEDEQAQESRRRRTHELAKKCGPFLERLFHAWDGMPSLAPVAEHVAWMQTFVADLGLDRAALENADDVAAWRRFWDELDHWCRRDRKTATSGRGRTLDRKTFLHRLGALAVEAGVARTPRGPGRVRVLSAPLARHHDAEYLFVMGLGERSFPRLAAPSALLDETERQAFRQAGLDLPGVGDLLPAEMLLFYQLVTRARRQLTLSYPAVDERGQDLLPSSFLNAVLDCFLPGAVSVQRRNMLIEGYDRDEPLSPAEHRVRTAARAGTEATAAIFSGAGLAVDLASNLAAAAEVARCRFRDRDYTPYDGLFGDAAVIGELRHLFGPEKVFSPTALEDYVACPFRFFLGHVLRLEPLEEPSEEIEVTRRGQAVHRALSRLHKQLRAAGLHQPADVIDVHVLERFREAIAEDVARAPGAASKALWKLEGERLLRVAARYRGQWQDFVKPWGPLTVTPEPFFFEVDFGLPAEAPLEGADGAEAVFCEPLVIRGGDIEVRISGRIDRVDVARLSEGVGFWIIDYKTGRTEHYTSKALADFQRLQLTLYALAVEEVLLAGQQARPLGLAYWLVAGDGPKVVLPTRNQVLWFNESERWRQVRRQLQDWVLTLVANIRGGVYPLKPRSETCTQTCQFSQVCRISQSRSVDKSWSLPLPQLAEAVPAASTTSAGHCKKAPL